MDWGTELWDRCDVIEKHTHSGLELVEKYVKFVKERTEIEQNYAKQLRNLSKKFNLKRNSKEEPDVRLTSYQSFMEVLSETNDYAGQRELVAENMLMNICADLTKYLQELKLERKSYLMEAKKAQQALESTNKQLESSKKRFEREWREAERASQNADKTDQDNNATKADVEKAKQQAHMRAHVAEECKNDYAAQLQNFNKEQKQFYFTDMPVIFNKMQELDERRMRKLAQGYILYSDIEKQVMPIIGKCLDGITKAGTNVNEKHDTMVVIEQNKSGFDRPGDVEFEDFSQGMNRTSSDGSVGTPKGSIDHTVKNRSKNFWIFSKKSKKFTPERIPPAVTEDFTHLPPEQRRKRLQEKLEETGRRLQKEIDQSEALEKMKGVYEKNPDLGDAGSLVPQINHTNLNIERLRQELNKYETWLAEAGGRGDTPRYKSHSFNNNDTHEPLSLDGAHSDGGTPDASSHAIYAEFDDDFEDEELAAPIGNCTAMYNFPGASEGTIAMKEGEVLAVVEEDKGDGWTRVRRSNGDEGYIPTSYVSISLHK
ncbi:cdc42-interacting protein 4 homolog isoform X2 [Syngnathus typhle]|uniref:cdc42-interacting protein 4 homolog isoform X2 n=1 Tax=Syngnathus typhle TaxID=161592 RepID=UPI002A6B3077|nr:cdc42-interacting protein 4 homolog isoform X2 [Syngnathus typhle]